MPTCRAVALTTTLLFFAAPATAQTTDIATDDMKKKVMAEAEKKPEDGWKAKAKVGATFAMNHNDSVVGTEDGLTLQLGIVLNGQLNYREGQHAWDNELSLQETQTQTPQLPVFVKSLDQLDLTSTYTYRFQNPGWLGLFAKALFNTQIFNGDVVATAPNTQVRQANATFDAANPAVADTTAVETLANIGDARQITSPFEPFNMRQSVGLFAEPITEPMFNLSAKLGVGAQEILTGGNANVLVTTFDDAGNTIAVIRSLESAVVEIGAEAQVDVKGDLIEKVLSYYASVNVFYPPFSTSEVERDFVESLNLRLKAGASLKVTKAISVDYVLTILRIPATTEDFQIQNGLLISAGFDLI